MAHPGSNRFLNVPRPLHPPARGTLGVALVGLATNRPGYRTDRDSPGDEELTLSFSYPFTGRVFTVITAIGWNLASGQGRLESAPVVIPLKPTGSGAE